MVSLSTVSPITFFFYVPVFPFLSFFQPFHLFPDNYSEMRDSKHIQGRQFILSARVNYITNQVYHITKFDRMPLFVWVGEFGVRQSVAWLTSPPCPLRHYKMPTTTSLLIVFSFMFTCLCCTLSIRFFFAVCSSDVIRQISPLHRCFLLICCL